MLLEHGLHESEAKVYLALLEQPRMNAGSLAKAAVVRRSHLYKVLEDLQEQGLVEVFADQGSRAYRARPFSEYLDRKATDLRRRLVELEEQRVALTEVLRPPSTEIVAPDAGDVRLLLGRRAVARELDSILATAETSILLGLSQGSVDRAARFLAPHWPGWQARGRAPRVTVILPPDTMPSIDWARLPEGGTAEVRWFTHPRQVISVVVDRQRLIVVHPIPDSADPLAGRDFALVTDDRAISGSKEDLLLAASSTRSPRGDLKE